MAVQPGGKSSKNFWAFLSSSQVRMRPSEVLFLWGSLFLYLGRSCSADTRTWPGLNRGESLAHSQTQKETRSLLLPFNRTQRSEPVPYYLSHKLKVYQLKKPQQQQDLGSQASADPWGSASSQPTSEQQGHGETVLAQELLEQLIPGPDLNPPLEPESEVRLQGQLWSLLNSIFGLYT